MTTRQYASWIGLGTSYGCLGVPEQVCLWQTCSGTRVSGSRPKDGEYRPLIWAPASEEKCFVSLGPVQLK